MFSEPNKTKESSGDSGKVGEEGILKNERAKKTACEEQGEDDGVKDGSDAGSDGGSPVVPFQLPPIDCISLTSQDETMGETVDDDSSIIAPPYTFSGDDSATPTPQLETESVESGTITPRTSPCDINTPLSPLSPKPQPDTIDHTPPVEVYTYNPFKIT